MTDFDMMYIIVNAAIAKIKIVKPIIRYDFSERISQYDDFEFFCHSFEDEIY